MKCADARIIFYRRSWKDTGRCREMAQAPGTVYSSLVNADLTFDPIKAATKKSWSDRRKLYPADAEPGSKCEKAAFESFYGGYGKVLNTAAGLLNAQVSQLKFFAKARKYPNALHASLDATNVPVGSLS